MRQLPAIGLGEILWDVLPDKKLLGGAPANFAYHFSSLGGLGFPVSRIGNDELGQQALDVLHEHKISTDHISIDPSHSTGTVDATIDEQGVATYSFPDDVAWDFLSFGPETQELATTVDTICFGTLAQRSPHSRKSVQDLLREAPQALKIFDINLRQFFYTAELIHESLTLADVLKINDDELRIASNMLSLPSAEKEALRALQEKYDLKLAVLTRGSEGSLILSTDSHSELPGSPSKVVDTIGAGDSFTAAMALAMLRGCNLNEINEYATRIAAHVCGQAGAMPVMPTSLSLL